MTPQAFLDTLEVLGMTPSTVARQLGVSHSQVRRWLGWAEPAKDIPPEVADWLIDRMRLAEKTPPPRALRTPRPVRIAWKRQY